MVQVKCRDCSRIGSEDPNDPAPALCPSCYEARLKQITPLFIAKADEASENGNITPAIVWLAQALEDIAGETRDYARKHANYLGHMLAIKSRQQQN